MALTRYRLTSSTTAPGVTPAIQSYSHTQTSRRQLLTSDSSALTTSAYTPDGADHLVAGDAHHIQFVSAGLAAGLVFTSGNALKLCVQGLEAHANNNLELQLFVSIVDSAGTTVRATIRSKVVKTGELNTSLRSLFLSTTLSGSYTTVANDRLVVEISVVGTPTASGGTQGHNSSLRWGGNGAGGDLLENDTQTGTTLNPWIEFETTDPPLAQAGYRWRNDDGSETTATWKVAENTGPGNLALDTNHRLRFVVDETGGVGAVADLQLQLQYRKNGGAYTNVNASSSNVRSSASTQFAEEAATTRQLSSGTGTFVAGAMDEDEGLAGEGNQIDLAAGNLTEVEYCFQLRSADLVGGDTLDFRLVKPGAVVLDAYTQTPSLTIVGITLTQEGYRFREDSGNGENSSRWSDLENTPIENSYRFDQPFMLRFVVSTADDAANLRLQIQYRKNAGTWTNITTSSTNIRARDVTAFGEENVTTRQLSSGSGTFATGRTAEDGIAGSTDLLDLLAGQITEVEFGLEIRNADVAEGDDIEFRLVQSPSGAVFAGGYLHTPLLKIRELPLIGPDRDRRPVKVNGNLYDVGSGRIGATNVGSIVVWKSTDNGATWVDLPPVSAPGTGITTFGIRTCLVGNTLGIVWMVGSDVGSLSSCAIQVVELNTTNDSFSSASQVTSGRDMSFGSPGVDIGFRPTSSEWIVIVGGTSGGEVTLFRGTIGGGWTSHSLASGGGGRSPGMWIDPSSDDVHAFFNLNSNGYWHRVLRANNTLSTIESFGIGSTGSGANTPVVIDGTLIVPIATGGNYHVYHGPVAEDVTWEETQIASGVDTLSVVGSRAAFVQLGTEKVIYAIWFRNIDHKVYFRKWHNNSQSWGPEVSTEIVLERGNENTATATSLTGVGIERRNHQIWIYGLKIRTSFAVYFEALLEDLHPRKNNDQKNQRNRLVLRRREEAHRRQVRHRFLQRNLNSPALFVPGVTPIGKEFQALWDIRTAIGDSIETRWDQRLALGKQLQLLWEIHGDAPIVKDVTTTQIGTNSATWNVNMPATVDPGDLLMMVLASDEASNVTTPTGWERIRSTDGGGAVRLSIYAKRAIGNEDGTTVAVSLAAAQAGGAQVYRIINYSGLPAAPGFSTPNSTTVNPPNTLPNWGTRDHLFIIAIASDTDTGVSSYSTGFTDNQTVVASGAGDADGATLITATRTVLNSSSQDPTNTTLTDSVQSSVTTVALRGPVKYDDIGFMRFFNLAGSKVTTPDEGALDITGDLDVRVCLLSDEPGGNSGLGVNRHQNIITKGDPSSATGSWVFRDMTTNSNFSLSWREAGGTVRTATSVGGVAKGTANQLRAVLDVDNGSGQYAVSFYVATALPSADPDSISWNLLNTVTGSTGPTSINSSTSPVWLGNRSDEPDERFAGDIYYVQVRDGIDGTKVLNVDFRTRDQYVHDHEAQDDFRTWTIGDPAKWYVPAESPFTAVGDSISLLWDLRAAVGDSVQLAWDLRTVLGDTVSLLWDQRFAQGDNVFLLWDLKGAVGDEVSLRWDQRGAIGKVLQLVWDLFTPLGDTISLLWDLRSTLGDTASLRWDISGPVGKQFQALWDIYAALGDSVELKWDVFEIGAVGDEISLLWDVRTVIGDTTQLLWDLRSAVGDQSELQWDINTPVGDQLALLWDLRAAAGDNAILQWDLHVTVADTLSLLWDILRDYVYLRPVATLENDGWESGPTTGLPLWDQINESSPSDADYITNAV